MIQQNELAKASEKKVLEALMQKSPQSWSELLQSTQIRSSRTLTKALNRLLKKELIYRQIQTGTEKYPPPVVYGLTQKGDKAIIPILFGTLSFWWAMGYKAESTKILKVNGRTVSETPPEDKMSLFDLINRIFARAIYGFVKYLETGNIEWYEYTKSPLMINPFILRFFGWEQFIIRVEHGMKTSQPVLYIMEDLKGASASPEEVAELKKRTRKMFPKEWRYLEASERAATENIIQLNRKGENS